MELKKYDAGHFVWIPKHLRTVDKHGFAIPKDVYKEDIRVPLFWIKSEGYDLYLINNSGFTITAKAETYGFVEDIAVSSNQFYLYENIQNGEAVKIDEYDPYYDSDFTLQTRIQITADRLGGTIILETPFRKKMIEEHVLYWDEDFCKYLRALISEGCVCFPWDLDE